ncbi:hypothetical protein [Nonomuraea soli]|uniref:Mersacidin/lichenicidin family type 2 lantibiotic n=1 Tax=Nonomuraea soli TaxID=1032476 RepID=A0A7W0CNA9_9ACTN|nr:hypothetical protein [Nonomuraea soli]MBA2894321.1 hypothetical protein [Nonomuraea soli]
MSDHELVQQWKNPHTRAAGTEHPAGDVVLARMIVGGRPPATEGWDTWGCCKTSWSFCTIV